MTETRWTLRLEDKASRPARKIAQDLRAMRLELQALGSVTNRKGTLLDAGGMWAASPARRAANNRATRSENRRTANEQVRNNDRVQRSRDRGEQRANQMAARMNGRAFRADETLRRRQLVQRERGERWAASRVARMNSEAFRRDQREQARIARQASRGAGRSGRRGGGLGLLGMGGIGLGLAGAMVGGTFNAASAIASMVFDVGQLALGLTESVLQMIAFREATLSTLATMAGGAGNPASRGIAAEQYRFAQTFARETPLDVQQVIGLQRQVSTAGFTGTQNREVMLGAADVGAANAGDSTAASRYILALSQIRNAGRLRAQEMNQLGEVGIGRRDLLLELGRQNNVARRSGETEDSYVTRLGQMQESRRFTGEQGVAAAQGVVRNRFNNGGALGGFARSQGETLFGTLSNLRGALFDLITGIDNIENLPGVRALKDTLNSVAATLGGTTATGKRLQGIIATVVNDFGLFFGQVSKLGENGSGIDGLIGGWIDDAKTFLPIFRELTAAFGDGAISEFRRQFAGTADEFRSIFGDRAVVGMVRELARSMVSLFGTAAHYSGRIVAGAAVGIVLLERMVALAGQINPLALGSRAGDAIGTLLAPPTIGEILRNGGNREEIMRERMNAVGMSAVDGLRQGMNSQLPALRADSAAMANIVPTTSRDTLGIKSPSRVMADMVGRHIPAGIAMGIDEGRSPLDRAMSQLVPTPGAGFGMGPGGLAGASINLTVQVQGTGNPEEDGRIAGEAALRVLLSGLEAPAFAGG